MALAIQTGGVLADGFDAWLDGRAPSREFGAKDKRRVLAHMLNHGILAQHDHGCVWLGARCESQFGRANFRKLYAVSESRREFEVRHERR